MKLVFNPTTKYCNNRDSNFLLRASSLPIIRFNDTLDNSISSVEFTCVFIYKLTLWTKQCVIRVLYVFTNRFFLFVAIFV